MKFVVDTNVPRTASGHADHVSQECQIACIEFIQSLISDKRNVICIDDRSLITEEYGRRLSRSGQPGVGDQFFKHVHDHQGGPRVLRSKITETQEGERGFEELPENNLDPDDRKFVAVAHVASARLVNAVDSGYRDNRDLLDQLDCSLKELCPNELR